MTARRAGWWAVAAVVVLVGLAGLVFMATLFVREGVRGSGDWASVLALVLAYLAAMAALLAWIKRQAVRQVSASDDEALVARLRRAVRLQWAMEVGTRQLRQPQPLRMRVRPTSRAVVAGCPAPKGSGQGGARLQESLVLGEHDSRPGRVLVEAFHADPCRQLVILGEAGAGKTTLAMLFTLAMVEAVGPDEPVPVLLSVAGWNPAQRVEQWVARRIVEDYPGLVGRRSTDLAAVTRLIEDRLVLPVLDGLDEMPGQLLGAAVTDLDRAAGTGLRMVMTCRSAEFEQAVAQAGPLSQAAVVDIEPVQVSDVELFLTQREVAGSTRWQPVLEAMRRDQDGPVASALSTPLMIALARRAYQPPTTHPERLITFASTDEIQRHLLEQFLRVVYPDPQDGAKARRWLAFLARHLRDRVQDPNLRWWQLARAMPPIVMTTVIAVAVTFLGALIGLGASDLPGALGADGAVANIGYGSFGGLCLGVLCGRHAARLVHARHRPKRRIAVWAAAAGVAVRDLGVLAVTVSVVICAATGLMLLALYPVAPQRAIELNGVVGVWAGALRNELWGLWLLLALLLLGIMTAVMIHGLSAARAGEPHRAMLRWRKLLPSLAAGVVAVIAIDLMLEPLALGSIITLILAVPVGAVIGLGRWLSGPLAEQTATSPEAVLRSDRAALLLTVGTIAVVVATVATAGMALLWGRHMPVAEEWMFVGVLAVSVAVVVLFGSGTAWMSYTFARLWLALWGQLPWRLTRFLRRAYTADVLRQVGPAYQFRHEVLRAYLAHHNEPTRRAGLIVLSANPTRPRRPFLRRWAWWRRLVGVSLALAILPTTALFIVPSPLRASLYSDRHWLSALAFGPNDMLASANNLDGVVWLWDADTGQLRRTLDTNANGISDLVFSPDGTLATAGTGGVQLWDSMTGQLRRTLAANDYWSSLAFSPDGTTLAVVDVYGTLQLWNPATGTLRHSGIVDSRYVSMAFSPDGSMLATGRGDHVYLRDAVTGQPRHSFQADVESIGTIVFNAGGTMLATAGSDGVIRLWNVAMLQHWQP